MSTLVEKLRDLKEALNLGLLTEEEYNSVKAEVVAAFIHPIATNEPTAGGGGGGLGQQSSHLDEPQSPPGFRVDQIFAGRQAAASRPIVPKTPNLRAALPGFVYDIFTVSRKDLVRRASDELANALHFFVMHSFIDTARWPTRIAWKYYSMKKAGESQPEVYSQIFCGPDDTRDGNRKNESKLHKDMFLFHCGLLPDTNHRGERVAGNVSRDYFAGTTMDLRNLLEHVRHVCTKWNPEHADEREGFYSSHHDNPADLCRDIRSLLNFFHHRNMEVPSIVTVGIDDTPAKIAAREASAAAAIISYVRRLVDCCVLERVRPTWEPKTASSAPPAYALKAAKECLCAARKHFNNVEAICDLFEVMYGGRPAEEGLAGEGAIGRKQAFDNLTRPQQKEETRNKLEALRRDLKAQSCSQDPNGAANLALLGLWTRFGPVSSYTEDTSQAEADSFSMVGGRGRGGVVAARWEHLVKTDVSRHNILEKRRPGQSFVLLEKNFTVDPIGITNLDLVNLALDLAGRGVRRMLVDAFDAYARNPAKFKGLARAEGWRPLLSLMEQSEQREEFGAYEQARRPLTSHSVFMALTQYIIRFEAKPMIELARIDEAPMATIFAIDQQATSTCLFQKFFDKVLLQHKANPLEVPDPMTWSGIAHKFITHTPYWSDPRYLCELVKNFVDDLEVHNRRFSDSFSLPQEWRELRNAAEALIKVRDISAHERSKTTFEALNDIIDKLVTFVHNIQLLMPKETTGVDVTALTEPKALVEIQSSLPHYRRWRGRQAAANMMNTNVGLQASREVLTWLLEPDEVDVPPDKREFYYCPNGLENGSEEALMRLMLMAYPDGTEEAAGAGGGAGGGSGGDEAAKPAAKTASATAAPVPLPRPPSSGGGGSQRSSGKHPFGGFGRPPQSAYSALSLDEDSDSSEDE